jgi:hypothetical protein
MADQFSVERPVEDALMVARRATWDPGQFTNRVSYHEGEMETLERWQAGAVLVALAAVEPDERWGSINARGPHITGHERVELKRVGLCDERVGGVGL